MDDIVSSKFTQATQWVLFKLNNNLYGFPIELVREMVVLQEIAKIPNTPEYFLGVTTLRDSTLPVMDLRIRLGLESLGQSRINLVETLKARKQDHIAWLQELRASVSEKRKFLKATDPHKCEFGKWYDSYTTEDLELSALLKKFDEPHRAIHGIAVKVKELEHSGKIDMAEQIMLQTEKKELKTMLELFDSLIAILVRDVQHIMIIVELHGSTCGMTVDEIDSVLTLEPEDVNPSPEFSQGKTEEIISGIATPKGSDKMVLLFEPDRLLSVGDIDISSFSS
jgi:purine-binding chemotaxis protein CheW